MACGCKVRRLGGGGGKGETAGTRREADVWRRGEAEIPVHGADVAGYREGSGNACRRSLGNNGHIYIMPPRLDRD
jgi:hypothetical protein